METRRSCLTIKFEIGPGAQIEHACEDLVEMAGKLGITLSAKFNDVILLARPGDDPVKLAGNWFKEFRSDRQYKIASTND